MSNYRSDYFRQVHLQILHSEVTLNYFNGTYDMAFLFIFFTLFKLISHLMVARYRTWLTTDNMTHII